MSKIFRPLILKKNAITYLDDVFRQSQTKDEMFTVLEQYHKKYSKFDVGKVSSSLHLPLKPDAVFNKQKASKVPIHLHDKVNRLKYFRII